MKVVITGGAGFVGANLTRYLIESVPNVNVTILDDFSTGYRHNVPESPQVEVIEGSILENDCLWKAIDGADGIVHLAAVPSVPRSVANPKASHDANATGTLAVLDAARQLGNTHTIVASSSSVYGANPVLPKAEALRPEPMSPYASSKLAAESYARAFAASYDLPVLVFRFFNIYGPYQAADHDYAAVIPAFVSAAMRREPIPLEGDGEQSRDFTYVGTVCSVIGDALIRKVISPEPINLAFGGRLTVNGLVSKIESILGMELETASHPARRSDVRHSQADASRLLEHFPDIKPVSIDKGLANTVAWFQQA